MSRNGERVYIDPKDDERFIYDFQTESDSPVFIFINGKKAAVISGGNLYKDTKKWQKVTNQAQH